MKTQPFKLDSHDTGVICLALEYFARTGANTDPCRMAAQLRARMATELPTFPEYMMIFPGVDVAALAPMLPENVGVYELTNDQAHVLESFILTRQDPLNAPLIRETLIAAASRKMASTLTGDFIHDLHWDGLITAKGTGGMERYYLTGLGLAAFDMWKGRSNAQGCAACDRGDYQLGHADHCPKKGVPDQTRYADPGPVRTCPACRGSGEYFTPGSGMLRCRECKGLKQVLVVPRAATVAILSDALRLWKSGQPDKAISALVQLIARLDEKLATLEADHNRTANEASMRANGIIPD